MASQSLFPPVPSPPFYDKISAAMMADRKQPPLSRRLRSVGEVAALMHQYYRSLYSSDGAPGRPIAWCSSVGPAELLVAMGFGVYYPENHAAVIGARRTALKYMTAAQAEGYAPEVCAYLRSDIGAWLAGETPLSAIDGAIQSPPRPSVLVYNTNQCRDIKEWFRWYADRMGVPCVGIESPQNIDTVTRAHIDAVSAQIQALIPPLEAVADRRFDVDALREAIRNAKKSSDLWRELLACARAHPAPLTFNQSLTLMGPAVVMRGTNPVIAVYERALQELQKRRAAGVGAQKRSHHRFYWEGMPVWGWMSETDRIFKRLGVAVVASTYCSSWVFDALDAERPFESMAEAYLHLFIARSDRVKERYLARRFAEFAVDAVIYHEAKTCPYNSNARYGLPERLGRSQGRPWTVVHGDHMDAGLFDVERFSMQLEALVERLERLR